jgi:hypothetical protein
MVFNATFNNIVVVSFIGGGPRENHRPVASHCPALSHNVVSSTHRQSVIRTHNVSGEGTMRSRPPWSPIQMLKSV